VSVLLFRKPICCIVVDLGTNASPATNSSPSPSSSGLIKSSEGRL
jgi:hypothetical protein